MCLVMYVRNPVGNNNYNVIILCRLAAYEELYKRMKVQAVEGYKGALNKQVGTALTIYVAEPVVSYFQV